jgi:phenylalanyl-tRNA synthetase beta chain
MAGTAAGRAGLDETRAAEDFFRILEPASRESEGLRVSMIPSLLDVVGHNLRHGWAETRVFEIGRTYHRRPGGAAELPEEVAWVGIGAAGGVFGPSRERANRSLDFLEFKGVVEALFMSFRIDGARWRSYTAAAPDLVPPGAVELVHESRSLGFAWEVAPEVRARWDMPRPVFVAQVRLEALPLETEEALRYREPSRHPAVRRDIALVVPAGMTQAAVRGWIRESAGPHLAGLELFDAYRGKHIPAGHAGLGFCLVFRAPDRTLEDKEADAAVDRVVSGLAARGIVRRTS